MGQQRDPQTGETVFDTPGLPIVRLRPDGTLPGQPSVAGGKGTVNINGMDLMNPELAGLGGFLLGGPAGAFTGAAGMQLAKDKLQGKPFDPVGAGVSGALSGAPGAILEMPGAVPGLLKYMISSAPGGKVTSALLKILGLGGMDAAGPAAAAGTGLDELAEQKIGGGLFRRGASATSDEGVNLMQNRSVDLENEALAKFTRPTGFTPPKLVQQLDELVTAIKTQQPVNAKAAMQVLQQAGLSPMQISALIKMRMGAGANAALAGRSLYEDSQQK